MEYRHCLTWVWPFFSKMAIFCTKPYGEKTVLSASTFTGYMAFSICTKSPVSAFQMTRAQVGASCEVLSSGSYRFEKPTEFQGELTVLLMAPKQHQSKCLQDTAFHCGNQLSPDTRGHCPPWGCLKWQVAPGYLTPACWGLHALAQQADKGLCSPCM